MEKKPEPRALHSEEAGKRIAVSLLHEIHEERRVLERV